MITIRAEDSIGNFTTRQIDVVVNQPTVARKVWCLQNTPNPAAAIGRAMALSEVTGFSMRFPWKDRTTTLLNQGKALAGNKEYSIRFMAGRHTPTTVIMAGPHYTAPATQGFPEQECPMPFNPDGSPNTVFEAAYADEVELLADYAEANGIYLLHLPWYGQNWAELYHGLEIRNAPGYTYQRWLTSHKRLIDIGYAVWQTHQSLTMEWPLSGHGPISGSTPAAKDLANYMISKFGADGKFRGQANGWGLSAGQGGVWGSDNINTENQLTSEVLPLNFRKGIQSIQPTTNWTDAQIADMMDELTEWNAPYCEHYTPTLDGASGTRWNNAFRNHPWKSS